MQNKLYIAVTCVTLLFIVVTFIERIWRKLNHDKYVAVKGKNFEYYVASMIEKYDKEGMTLRNVYLPSYNGMTSEIDVIRISKKGLLIVECKSYTGIIKGHYEEKMWSHYIPKSFFSIDRYELYNPVRQNEGHIKWLQKQLGKEYKIYSIIVFDDTANIRRVKGYEKSKYETLVINASKIKKMMRGNIENKEDTLSKADISTIYASLARYAKNTNRYKARHAANVRKIV